MVDSLVGTEIEKAVWRATAMQWRDIVLSDSRRGPDDDVQLARQRAENACIRARRAAESAAVSLEKSARLHDRVAEMDGGNHEKSARLHREYAEEDRRLAEQKRREAAGE